MGKTTAEEKGSGNAIPPPNLAKNRGKGIHPAKQSYDYIPVDHLGGEIVGIDGGTYFERLRELHPEREPVSKFKGDVLDRETFLLDGVKITRFPNGRLTFSGSLHTFWNKGKHNANQFPETAFDEVKRRLASELLLTPENIRLTRLEYGVNITPPIPCNDILGRCFQHRGSPIQHTSTRTEGNFRQAKHDAYALKFYDKGKQYQIGNEPILRVEIKVTNFTHLRKKGIVTLADFIKTDKSPFVQNLIDQWQQVVFADPTTEYPDKWHRFTNPQYWETLREGNRQKFNRRFKRLKEVNAKHGDNIQEQIAAIILANIQGLQKTKNDTFTTFIPQRVCKVTGLNIHRQKRNSKLLSHAGLKNLRETDPQAFRRIKRRYLTDKWSQAPFEVQIREIAHNIRNQYYNPRKKRPGWRNENQLMMEF